MSKLGITIANDINKRESLNRAVVTPSIVFNYIGMSTPDINLEPPNDRWYDVDLTNNETLIWGHPIYGEWGAYNWGASLSGANTTILYTMNTNNDFREHFRDTEFVDTTNTTATVDTTNFKVTF